MTLAWTPDEFCKCRHTCNFFFLFEYPYHFYYYYYYYYFPPKTMYFVWKIRLIPE